MFPPLDILLENWIEHVYIPYCDILQRSSRLYNWLSLRSFVSWINHLPPVCWSTLEIKFFMAQVMLYFIHSTWVLPFYIDVVLTLSILTQTTSEITYVICIHENPFKELAKVSETHCWSLIYLIPAILKIVAKSIASAIPFVFKLDV